MDDEIKQDESHFGFTINSAGLRINFEQPYLAASPDGIFYCQCHGDGVVEVKCPFKHRDRLIKDAAMEDCQFCLQINGDGNLFLVREHPYYYQVQLQMYVCKIPLCHFIVYTSVDEVCLPVALDNKFIEKIIPHYKMFVLNVVIPEISGKYFTKTRNSEEASNRACQTSLPGPIETSSNGGLYIKYFCNQIINSPIFVCCDDQCRVKSYHRHCLIAQGKKRFGENWRCDVCKKKARKLSLPRKPLKEIQ